MAVYTELTHSEINNFLSAYNLPPLQRAEGIRAGVENTNYLLILKDGRKLILTLFEQRVSESDLPFFTGLMEHLANQSIPSPMPLHAGDGNIIRQVKGKPAIIVTFLEGKEAHDIILDNIRQLGRYTAKLHLAVADYKNTRNNALCFSGWKEILAKISGRADEITQGLANELQNEIAALESAWPDNLPSGVIHADLFPDNVFYDAQSNLTGIIDFYFACNDFFAYELAICLNSWCFDNNWQFSHGKARELFSSYNAIRQLSGSELEALPVLARGAAFRFLLTRAHDWLFQIDGALVTPKDPKEYLAKLRFHQTISHYTEYGI